MQFFRVIFLTFLNYLLFIMTRLRFLLAVVIACVLGSLVPARTQIIAVEDEHVNVDSLKRAFADTHYYFGLYRDNYFIFGPPIGTKPTAANTNVKFQISIAQKLTKSTLPWGTYLYLYYTQKVFWNVLQNSMPMTDLNFNPGIGLAKPIFIKDRFIGKLNLQLEHESNGRDGRVSTTRIFSNIAVYIRSDGRFRPTTANFRWG